jgi:hypothetical protein
MCVKRGKQKIKKWWYERKIDERDRHIKGQHAGHEERGQQRIQIHVRIYSWGSVFFTISLLVKKLRYLIFIYCAKILSNILSTISYNREYKWHVTW